MKQAELLIKVNVELEATDQICGLPPLPSLPWTREEMSRGLSAFTLVTDFAQLGVSGIGILVEVGSMSTIGPVADAAEPIIPPPIEAVLVGVAAYQATTLDQWETTLSGLGFTSTALADGFADNSYIDRKTAELVIGQDTSISAVSFLLSWTFPEAFTDFAINSATTYYDYGRFNNEISTIFELRIKGHGGEGIIDIKLLDESSQ